MRIQLLRANALPRMATKGAVGLDLCAVETATLSPGGATRAFHTGIAVEIPEGYAGLVCPRSGLARSHGVTVLNAPGVIDNDYRGEVQVLLINHGCREVEIRTGDRIAQLLLVPVQVPLIEVVDTLGGTERGANGFGSTGR